MVVGFFLVSSRLGRVLDLVFFDGMALIKTMGAIKGASLGLDRLPKTLIFGSTINPNTFRDRSGEISFNTNPSNARAGNKGCELIDHKGFPNQIRQREKCRLMK